jgi:hypothetical protein
MTAALDRLAAGMAVDQLAAEHAVLPPKATAPGP